MNRFLRQNKLGRGWAGYALTQDLVPEGADLISNALLESPGADSAPGSWRTPRPSPPSAALPCTGRSPGLGSGPPGLSLGNQRQSLETQHRSPAPAPRRGEARGDGAVTRVRAALAGRPPAGEAGCRALRRQLPGGPQHPVTLPGTRSRPTAPEHGLVFPPERLEAVEAGPPVRGREAQGQGSPH